MKQLQKVERNGQRVLTTSQLAEAYETDNRRISENFNRNISRFKEGKHYHSISGTEKSDFLNHTQIADGSKNASVLYLWTEKGAWLHAKSLNTDAAWDAYEMLVDDYYTIKENVTPLSKDQALVTVLRTTADLVENFDLVVKEQNELRKLVTRVDQKVEEQITIDHGEQRRLQKAVAKRVYEITGEKEYQRKLFREIYREIKDRFAVSSYKDVKRKELQQAIQYIEHFIPRRVVS